jgi:hypothetical protein
VDSLDAILTPSQRGEVVHLIEHDELGEALRTLAWIIVEEDKRIPFSAYESILELSVGLIAPDDLPKNLAAHIRSSDTGG